MATIADGAGNMKWTAEEEVEAVKQQLPSAPWREGASLARCVEDLRMDRDQLRRLLREGLAMLAPLQKGHSTEEDWFRVAEWTHAVRKTLRTL